MTLDRGVYSPYPVGMDKVEKALRTIASELRNAEDTLADHEEYLDQWAFSMTPSERRRRAEEIERDEKRLDACQRAAIILECE